MSNFEEVVSSEPDVTGAAVLALRKFAEELQRKKPGTSLPWLKNLAPKAEEGAGREALFYSLLANFSDLVLEKLEDREDTEGIESGKIFLGKVIQSWVDAWEKRDVEKSHADQQA